MEVAIERASVRKREAPVGLRCAEGETVLSIRRSEERGAADHGWLDTRHTFSFANYYDPSHMGFRALRVINEDKVWPGRGFGTHPHRDMEIISYVLEGALEHRDSMGNGSVVRAGDVQRMSAGTGIRHSEFNHSPDDELHFLQIWISPSRRGFEPSYEQLSLDRREGWRLVASPDGQDGSTTIHQDARLFIGQLELGTSLFFERPEDRHVWLHVAKGQVTANGELLSAGDGASSSDLDRLDIEAQERSEVLLFDLG